MPRRRLLFLLLLLLATGGILFFFCCPRSEAEMLFQERQDSIQWAFQPQFEQLSGCNDGACLVESGKIIDYSGNLIGKLRPRTQSREGKGGLLWGEIAHFSHNLLKLRENISDRFDQTYYIDKKGRRKIDRNFENGHDFSEGLAAVQREMMWGFIDTNGQYQIQPDFWAAEPFSEGRAAVGMLSEEFYNKKKRDEELSEEENVLEWIDPLRLKWGLINKQGEWVVSPQFKHIQPFSEGLAWACVADSSWGVIDTMGNWVAEPYRKTYPKQDFHDGLCLGEKGGMGNYAYFLNAKGDTLFNNLFVSAAEFSEGLAAVWSPLNGAWGYINTKGELVIAFIFDEAGIFSQGLAAVKREGRYGYINRKGEMAVPFAFEKARAFSKERVAMVLIKNQWGLLKITPKD